MVGAGRRGVNEGRLTEPHLDGYGSGRAHVGTTRESWRAVSVIADQPVVTTDGGCVFHQLFVSGRSGERTTEVVTTDVVAPWVRSGRSSGRRRTWEGLGVGR